MWWIIAASVICIPVYISSSGQDAFRVPKDLLLTSTALLLVILLSAAPWTFFRNLRLTAFPLVILSAIGWSTISALCAGNQTLAWRSTGFAVAVAIFVLATWALAPAQELRAAYLVAIPAAINAIVFLGQRFTIWDPLHVPSDLPAHFRYTALVGNPNDVGSFFVAPALTVVTLAIVDKRRRTVWSLLALLILAAVATGSLTAIAACVVGLFTLAIVHSHQKAAPAGLAVILLAGIIALAFAPLRDRLQRIRGHLDAGNYAEAFSGRVTPFLAAANMAKDHPLTGVGPGNFAYEYFPYKVTVEARHPELSGQYAHHFNFAQVHNDHLQVLAEVGVIGYVIAVAFLVVVASGARRNPQPSKTAEFSRLLSLPIALALATLCMAHFPLHLTAPVLMFGYGSALCVAWKGPRESVTADGQSRASRWRGAFVAALAAVLLTVGYRTVVVPYRCNTLTPGLRRSTLAIFDTPSDRREETARKNMARVVPCMEAMPYYVDLYMVLAANQRVLNRMEDAAATYTRALAYDRRPEIYYNLGHVQMELGQRDEGVANLYRAVLFDRAILPEIPFPDVRTELEARLQQGR